MDEESFCPHCDELVNLEFSDDYWEYPQGEEIECVDCPECNKPISISWEVSHSFNFSEPTKKECGMVDLNQEIEEIWGERE